MNRLGPAHARTGAAGADQATKSLLWYITMQAWAGQARTTRPARGHFLGRTGLGGIE